MPDSVTITQERAIANTYAPQFVQRHPVDLTLVQSLHRPPVPFWTSTVCDDNAGCMCELLAFCMIAVRRGMDPEVYFSDLMLLPAPLRIALYDLKSSPGREDSACELWLQAQGSAVTNKAKLHVRSALERARGSVQALCRVARERSGEISDYSGNSLPIDRVPRTSDQLWPWCERGGLTMMCGDPGVGKSAIMAWILGALVFPERFELPGPPLAIRSDEPRALVVSENPQQLLLRLESWGVPLEGIAIHSMNPADPKSWGALLTPEERDRFAVACFQQRPELVVVDTIRSNFPGDENSSEFASWLVWLKALVRHIEACGIVLHHPRKSPAGFDMFAIKTLHDVRGSSALAGACSNVLMMQTRHAREYVPFQWHSVKSHTSGGVKLNQWFTMEDQTPDGKDAYGGCPRFWETEHAEAQLDRALVEDKAEEDGASQRASTGAILDIAGLGESHDDNPDKPSRKRSQNKLDAGQSSTIYRSILLLVCESDGQRVSKAVIWDAVRQWTEELGFNMKPTRLGQTISAALLLGNSTAYLDFKKTSMVGRRQGSGEFIYQGINNADRERFTNARGIYPEAVFEPFRVVIQELADPNIGGTENE